MNLSDKFTRRDFLKTSALVTAAAVTTKSHLFAESTSVTANSERLIAGWEHYRGSLGGPWEVWHGAFAKDANRWTKVELPHCFNARDAVNPDLDYYRGQGWYRTNLKIANPFPNGRTL